MSTKSSRVRRVRPRLEALETIQLLASNLTGGLWTIAGTGKADTIVVARDAADPSLLHATINGKVVSTQTLADVQRIKVLGLSGNDTIRIDEVKGAIPVEAVLKGGGGRDTLTGGSGKTVLDGGGGPKNILIAGSGQTTLLRGVAPETSNRFGTAGAFRRFLRDSVSRSGRLGMKFRAPGTIATIGDAAPTAGGGATTGHSTTNVQVAGVDEADIVETDGKTLYVLSRGELLTLDATDPSAPKILSRTSVDGSPLGAYLDGTRLTVVSSVWLPATTNAGATGKLVPTLIARGSSQVQVTTYDVSNLAKPTVAGTTKVDGWYSDSRMVDGKLYLVVQNDLLSGVGYSGGIALANARLAAPAFNARKLADAPIESLLPSYETTVTGADGKPTTSKGLLVQPESILQPASGDDPNLLSVAVLDTRGGSAQPLATTGLLGTYASTIHVSGDQLYLFSPTWDDSGVSSTNITQLSLKGNDLSLVATGHVDGTLINQYAADAHDGTLRIATTDWRSEGQTNALYVLKADAGKLGVIGSIENIAPGESLYSARFDGDRAYLVTFEQVDPLFAIDLSNPTAPKIAGELKVPGFSRFLQPVGAGYLLGIGREVDPTTNQTQDIKISLFDVRDLSKPTLLDTATITNPGANWSWSAAEWDPHAFGWFPEIDTLAIPVSGSVVTKTDADGNPTEWATRSALDVFHLDVNAGASALDPIGAVSHDSDVMRSVRIGDVLYSIADQDVWSVRVQPGSIQALGQVTIQTATSGWPASNGGPIAID